MNNWKEELKEKLRSVCIYQDIESKVNIEIFIDNLLKEKDNKLQKIIGYFTNGNCNPDTPIDLIIAHIKLFIMKDKDKEIKRLIYSLEEKDKEIERLKKPKSELQLSDYDKFDEIPF